MPSARNIDMGFEDDPRIVWLAGGLIGSLTGFAKLLNSDDEITMRAVVGSLMFSGLIAMGLVAVLYHYHGDEHLWLSIAVSVLGGFGANGIADLALALFMKFMRTWFPK